MTRTRPRREIAAAWRRQWLNTPPTPAQVPELMISHSSGGGCTIAGFVMGEYAKRILARVRRRVAAGSTPPTMLRTPGAAL